MNEGLKNSFSRGMGGQKVQRIINLIDDKLRFQASILCVEL